MRGARRGSVVLVVVALLALLAVMGTVYIISARSERVSANAMSEGVNLDMARDAVHAQVRDAMSRSMYDATGVIGGLWHAGSYGNHAARRWTMPELGLTNGLGTSNDNATMPDDTWLATNLYRDGFALDARYNDFSYLTPYAFNPANGTYDPAMPNFDPFTGQPAMPTIKVVADDPTVSLDDGILQMLPFSEGNGVRYRFGVRIIDTSRMANMRVGTLSPSTLMQDGYGTNLGSYALGHSEIFDPADDLQSLAQSWHRAAGQVDLTDELELRAYGSLGTPLIPAVVGRSPLAPVWAHTLGNRSWDGSVVGNYRRGYYTTNSYSRDLRPYIISTDQSQLVVGPHSAFTLTPPGGSSLVIWPPFPRRVGANPSLAFNDYIAADNLAYAATNIATAMERIAGYSHAEACTFAANYISFRWNSWRPTSVSFRNKSMPAYYLFDGASFIDDQGICFSSSRSEREPRPAPFALGGAGTPDLRAEKGTVHLGFSAQPFINELAVHQTTAGVTGPEDDCAIEFYNPFNTALSLIGYRLRLRADRQIDLNPYFVPPRGYLVITRKWDELAKKVDGKNAVWAVNPQLSLSDCSTIYLMREFIPRRKHELFYAAIDQYDCSSLANAPPDADRSTGGYFERRSNHDADPSDADDLAHWCVAAPDADLSSQLRHDTKEAKEHMTLGSANPTDDDQAIRLYDRFADRKALQRSLLYNVNEFNRIMRVGHVVDASTGLPVKQGLISTQLVSAIREPKKEVAQTQFPADAGVHFDFRAAPWIFNATGNSGPEEPPPPHENPYPPGDIRAQRLLDSITLLPGYQLRTAGQINVNTASAEVLRTIPILNENPNWVAAILAYRWRTTSLDPRIPPDYRSGLYDFSDSLTPGCKYPGYGIRSLAELEVPLSFPFSAANSIDQRDALWADVYNLCTVRSDTFVVYGYLEGVKQNPRYAGAFDNSRSWYQTGAAVTDDVNNRSAPLLRVARRRWVALMDRSQSSASRVLLDGLGLDPGFALPRVLAVKDMAR